MPGYRTRCVLPTEQSEDPERIAIREALVFGKAVYDQRRALGLSVADLAGRADMAVDEIERIEEGGAEPTIALLLRLGAALDADVRLTAGHDLGLWFEPHTDVRARACAAPTARPRPGQVEEQRALPGFPDDLGAEFAFAVGGGMRFGGEELLV
jgi:transcriptional regulator with XRE-family HTH domain